MWPLPTHMLLHEPPESPPGWPLPQSGTVELLRLRKILARPAQRKGWSINSCQINSCQINSWQITGRFGGSRVLDGQESSERSSRVPWIAAARKPKEDV